MDGSITQFERTGLGESGAEGPAVFIPVSGHTGEREGKGRGLWIRDFPVYSIQSLVVILLSVNEPVVNIKTSYRNMILVFSCCASPVSEDSYTQRRGRMSHTSIPLCCAASSFTLLQSHFLPWQDDP